MTGAELPGFVAELVARLRRRGLPLGVDDCRTLRSAVAAGFGVGSAADFEQLCISLWAKSLSEQETVRAVLAGVELPRWDATGTPAEPGSVPSVETPHRVPSPREDPAPDSPAPPAPQPPEVPRVQPLTGMALLPPSTGQTDASLAVAAQFPLTAREIAQTWRRLRRPVRYGTPSEVDLDATLDRHARTGVFEGPVLVPPRRNTARLLLLVDRHGSMTPYEPYVEHLVREIRNAGRLESIDLWYFHNLPSNRVDTTVLGGLTDPFDPRLDPVLDLIAPMGTGRLYADPDLTQPRPFPAVLAGITPGATAAVISDAGAARGTLQTGRLVGTVAMLKALRAVPCPVAWINPVPAARWGSTTAEQVARHVPMSPLTAEGLHRAVDALRGRPHPTERPL
ncbi:hypothetical protein [Paractinoplanes brasiliensis]|uniref:VWA domain containing CoxE-like protein n=1 Tax=Paractinoplanes brasiliensis TaxID=52695 RepID=A0A4V3C655_9ACTN|nr:hypothetical protein [Actinoplanes brasiliensis]TDO32448.1 hypothetical protein C8E87_7909 [Actinoplanes brasiliensis]GID27680.1 hypothetical protein Abr02nite_26630 [Actinoplanes brasiliensis]